jgi:hypothetical protein
VCSCHFVNGEKSNGPAIFTRNKDKLFMFEDTPQKRKRRLPPQTREHQKAMSKGYLSLM